MKAFFSKQIFKPLLFLLTAALLLSAAVPCTAAAAREERLCSLIDSFRAENGCALYRRNALLSAAAERKARDMLQNGYFAHESPTLGTAQDLVRSMGGPSYCLENIARYGSVEKAHAALCSSAGHRRNLLSHNMNAMGVCVLPIPSGGVLVVELFARF